MFNEQKMQEKVYIMGHRNPDSDSKRNQDIRAYLWVLHRWQWSFG